MRDAYSSIGVQSVCVVLELMAVALDIMVRTNPCVSRYAITPWPPCDLDHSRNQTKNGGLVGPADSAIALEINRLYWRTANT
jgi:hypothetical protein